MSTVNIHAPSTWECVPDHLRSQIQPLDASFEQFIWRLKRCELTKSVELVSSTVNLLDTYIANSTNFTSGDFITLCCEMARQFNQARSIELIVGNVVRQILKIIEHESLASLSGNPTIRVDRSIERHAEANPDVLLVSMDTIREAVQEEVISIIDVVTNVDASINQHSHAHFYSNEIILTSGYSRTVLNFLKRAYKSQRRFQVVVLEQSPSNFGHKMATALANVGISVTLLPDAALTAIMPTISKVVIGTHAVLANGSLIANVGTMNLCLTASLKTVPVIVLSGTHKITPLYALDINTYNDEGSPLSILDFNNSYEGQVVAYNPLFDHVPHDLVTLIITDEGAYTPSFIYKVITEQYSSEYYKF